MAALTRTWATCLAGLAAAALSACQPPKPAAPAGGDEWTDWRGPGRRGLSESVPQDLPAAPQVLWRRPLTGEAPAGAAATGRHVLVADKSADQARDIWRCLSAETGQPVWTLEYPATGPMDYSNSPRATPLICDGLVYLLGAFGDLHCVRLADGEVVWRKNVAKEFGAQVPRWGMSATPLLVDDRLIVNPGAADASLVALDRRTGEVLWKAPGGPAAYAALIKGRLGGRRQIVGYDAESLGGWDPATGRRLWRLVPEKAGDFNVPTPIDAGGRLLVATENNGTRLYEFDAEGVIRPEPVAASADLAPDASTPVLLDGTVIGCDGKLACLDVADGLRTLWTEYDDAFAHYASLIAGNGRVLVLTLGGELLLIEARRERCVVRSRVRLFGNAEAWSHPALVGNRLYVRAPAEVLCLRLE